MHSHMLVQAADTEIHRKQQMVADNRPKKTVARWSLTREALEQSSIFLSTLDVRHLAGVCSSLQSFIQNASGGGYWDDCHPQCARGKYCPENPWLHSLSSLRASTRFIMLAQDLQVLGTATFYKTSDLASLTEMLHQESAEDAFSLGFVATRFFIPWQFKQESITDLMEGSSLEAVGLPVRFKCKYGVSFAVQLVISKTFADSPELTFRLVLVESLGAKYLANFEIEISGSIIAPDMASSIVKLKKVSWGSHTRNASGDPDLDMNCCRTASPSNSKFCLNWLHFKELTSLVRVRVPRWLESTTLV